MMSRSLIFPVFKSACVIFVCAVAGCFFSRPEDPRLQGTFKSDRESTMAYLQSTGAYTDKQLDAMGGLYGELVVKYHRNTYTATIDGKKIRGNFRVIEQTQDTLVIECPDGLINDTMTNRITFTDDGFWVNPYSITKPYEEKFIRVE